MVDEEKYEFRVNAFMELTDNRTPHEQLIGAHVYTLEENARLRKALEIAKEAFGEMVYDEAINQPGVLSWQARIARGALTQMAELEKSG